MLNPLKLRLSVLAIVGTLLAVPASASAFEVDIPWIGPTGFDITETMVVRYLETNFNSDLTDDGILSYINRLNITLSNAPFTMGVRADSAIFTRLNGEESFFDDPCALNPDGCLFENYIRPEKVFMSWDFGAGSLTGGDFYTSFGRGLALSIRKVDELGVDTSIRGGRIVSEVGPWRMEALAGWTNIQNIEPITSRVLDDPNDFLAGFQSSLTSDDGIEVGVRGTHGMFATPEILGHEESTSILGASLEIPDLADLFAIYLEGALLRHRDFDPDSGDTKDGDGGAIYGSINGFFGPLNLLLEGKHYRGFSFTPTDNALRTAGIVYHAPPTLERFDQLVPSNSDVTGGRMRLNYYIRSSKTRLYANALYYLYTKDGSDPFGKKGAYALHAYAGIRQNFGRGYTGELSGGWRDERKVEDEKLVRTFWHVEGEFNLPFSGMHALNLKGEYRFEEKSAVPNIEFGRALLTATYSLRSVFRSSLLYGYTTERIASVPVHHVGAQLDWDFMPGSTMRFFGGRLPGGVICAGGTCVEVPASSSYRLEVAMRF